MKSAIKSTVLTAITALFLFAAPLAQAQEWQSREPIRDRPGSGGPPPPPGSHGGDQNISAPIGSGLLILLSLGLAYGGKKVYNARKRFS